MREHQNKLENKQHFFRSIREGEVCLPNWIAPQMNTDKPQLTEAEIHVHSQETLLHSHSGIGTRMPLPELIHTELMCG